MVNYRCGCKEDVDMDLLAGIGVLIAIFLANFLVGKAIRNKANGQLGLNVEVQTTKGVDCVVRDTENF
jgi:hypothetical protein